MRARRCLSTDSPAGCQCNTSWSEKLARYSSDAAAVASNLTTLQRAGVQVVWFSLFARDKNTHGGPDVVRSVADHVVMKQLRAAGFFGAGGRLVDQWPLYASYFGLWWPAGLRAPRSARAACTTRPPRTQTASCCPTSVRCVCSSPSTRSARAARGCPPAASGATTKSRHLPSKSDTDALYG